MSKYIPSPKKRRLDREMAMELWLQGKCDAEIAEACGVAKGTVTDWRKKSGLQAYLKIRKKVPAWLEHTAAVNAMARAAGMTYGQYTAPPVIVRGHRR